MWFLADLGARGAPRRDRPRIRPRGVQSRGDDKPKIDKEFIDGVINDLEKLRILAGLAKAAKLTNEHGITEYHHSDDKTRHATGMTNAQFQEYKRANQFISDFISKGMELQKIKGVKNDRLSAEDLADKQQTTEFFKTNVLAAMSAGGVGGSNLAGQKYLHAKAVADMIIQKEAEAAARVQGGLNQGLAVLNKKVSQGLNEAVGQLVGVFSNVGGSIEGMNAAIGDSYQFANEFVQGPTFGTDQPKVMFDYAASLSVIPKNADINNPTDVVNFGSYSIAVLAFPYIIEALSKNSKEFLSKLPPGDARKIAGGYIKAFAKAIQADKTGGSAPLVFQKAIRGIDKKLNSIIDGKRRIDDLNRKIKQTFQQMKTARTISELEDYATNMQALIHQLREIGGDVPINLQPQIVDLVQRKQAELKNKPSPTGITAMDDFATAQKKRELTALMTAIGMDLIDLESRVQTYKNYGGGAPNFNQINAQIQQARKIANDLGKNVDRQILNEISSARRKVDNLASAVATYTPIGTGPGVSTGPATEKPTSPDYNYYLGPDAGPPAPTRPPVQPVYPIAGLGTFSEIKRYTPWIIGGITLWMAWKCLAKK